MRVACSPDQEVILVGEWFGMPAGDLCTLALPEGAACDGCETVRLPDGRTLLRGTLPPYGGLFPKRKRL